MTAPCIHPGSPHETGGRLSLLSIPSGALILLIKGYQKLISPWLGSHCRFHPTCSNYCIDALRQHGMVHGLWLGLKRICKCHPFHPGGCDPVPGSDTKEDSTAANAENIEPAPSADVKK